MYNRDVFLGLVQNGPYGLAVVLEDPTAALASGGG